MEMRPLKLINNVKRRDELSSIESRIRRYETANSEVELPVVRRVIPPRKVLIQAKTIKHTSGYNSVIVNGTSR